MSEEKGPEQLTRRAFMQYGIAGLTTVLAGGVLSSASGATRPSAALESGPAATPPNITTVTPVGGVPTLVIDGQPHGPLAITRCAWSYEQLGRAAARNHPLHFEMVGSVGWPGEQEEVFGRLDAHMRQFLEAAPNARVILRLYLCQPPAHFLRDYPDEVLRFNDGSTQHYTSWYAMKDRPLEDRGYASFASTVWREKTSEALAHYVAHIRQSSYARNVIGYFICGGGTEEWYYWGDYDHNKICTDFSPAMLKALRAYLRGKYQSVPALRAAWNDPAVEFDTALPPDARSRSTDDTGVFWDPAKSQRARDYYWVHSKVMEDSLLLFAHTVKQACNREQVVGMFHGYLQNHWLLEGGQATLKDLLRSPDVDFWAGPPQYDRRGPGEHACIRFLNASLKQHGKLWFSEADYRTSFMSDTKANPSMRSRPPADVTEDLALFQRELAHELCEGANGWWFPMGQDWYVQEPIQAIFEQIQRIGKAGMEFERAGDTDIAAVVDLDSLLTAPPFTVNPALISDFKVQELPRIGAPVDFYELDDVLAPNAKPYKLYLLLNCFSLSAQERRLIDQRLRRNGAILVWMFAPGLFQPGQQPEMSPAHVKDLLGFELDSVSGDPMPLNMKLTEAGARYCQGFDPNRVFGSFERPQWVQDAEGNGKAVRPGVTKLRQRFFGSEGGEVLARFEDGGQPAIVMRQTARATDIWIGSVMAPADLLRSIAHRAGCHLFCDGDEIIYANRSFLAIHTQAEGERAFRLRRRADVVEVFSGEVLGENVTTFRDRVDARRTRLYYLGDRKRWEAALQHADAFFAKFRKS